MSVDYREEERERGGALLKFEQTEEPRSEKSSGSSCLVTRGRVLPARHYVVEVHCLSGNTNIHISICSVSSGRFNLLVDPCCTQGMRWRHLSARVPEDFVKQLIPSWNTICRQQAKHMDAFC